MYGDLNFDFHEGPVESSVADLTSFSAAFPALRSSSADSAESGKTHKRELRDFISTPSAEKIKIEGLF